METLHFPTLADYLAWRVERRAEYKALSKKIRLAKLEIRQRMRDGKYAGELQWSLATLKYEATKMMELRLEAKGLAAASWDQWRAAEQVAVAA